jgi:hypothetical protein
MTYTGTLKTPRMSAGTRYVISVKNAHYVHFLYHKKVGSLTTYLLKDAFVPVLRIRDVYPVSRIRTFSILDPVSASKNLSILTQKWFLSSPKYNPCCSSRIQVPNPDPDLLFPIPDPRSRGQKGTGSRIRIRNTALCDGVSFR